MTLATYRAKMHLDANVRYSDCTLSGCAYDIERLPDGTTFLLRESRGVSGLRWIVIYKNEDCQRYLVCVDYDGDLTIACWDFLLFYVDPEMWSIVLP